MAKRKAKQGPPSSGATRTRKAKRTAKPKQAPPPRGQIGPQTYDQVRKIVEEKKIPMGKAFEEVAKATGRKLGTVAVTYYRIARQKGGAAGKRRAAKAAGRTARRGRRPGAVGAAMPAIGAVLSRVSAAIQELESVIARQAAEITRLRGESKLADRIRKALRE